MNIDFIDSLSNLANRRHWS